ncbi:MAG TPA: SUMF1/EgtB/PvdO family nonheme iron enzyme [Planctomycetaceae bacterium]|nr:SUMF1/EgtB/PvdO family nonheme iron enzyme [Planctomycetaceae bacterium]
MPPGEYLMGPYEGHHVRITRPFYFGAYEVTRGQFARFVAASGYDTVAEKSRGGLRLDNSAQRSKWEPQKKYTWREPGFAQEDEHPVVQIAWHDAMAFCDWLSQKEGKRYRLPTEAEWEYACRAGTTGRFGRSNDLQAVTQFGNDAAAKAVFSQWDDGVKTSDGYVYTSPVGHFRPNNLGLYDTLGNAAEWCSDWYAEYDKGAPKDNPTGPAVGDSHVGRGGGFAHVSGTRYRYYGNDSFRRPDWGFRIACDISPAPTDGASAGVNSSKQP